MSTDVEETFLPIEGVTTSVLKCGESDLSNNMLALIIPGNPGVSQYYEEFMKVLYKESGGRLPVWCVAHAGHGSTPGHPLLSGVGVPDVFGLKGQIQHKLTFIRDHVPADTRLVLIGHSIGCYIILYLLQELEPHRVAKCLLLFPTVERMAESPKGRVVTPLLKYLTWISPYVTMILDVIPDSVKSKLIHWYFARRSIPSCAVEATKHLVNSSSVSKSLYMANQEMKAVKVADHDLIREHLDKLYFYYGATDHWCPVSFYQDMKQCYPDGDIELCHHGYAHAFVLESSAEMARVMWKTLEHKLCFEKE